MQCAVCEYSFYVKDRHNKYDLGMNQSRSKQKHLNIQGNIVQPKDHIDYSAFYLDVQCNDSLKKKKLCIDRQIVKIGLCNFMFQIQMVVEIG